MSVDRPVATVRNARLRIPQEEGKAHFVQVAVRLFIIAFMVIALGLAAGATTMMMLSDLCASLEC